MVVSEQLAVVALAQVEQEQKVKMHLENEVRKARLEERIKSVLIPSEDVIEMKNGKKKVKNR